MSNLDARLVALAETAVSALYSVSACGDVRIATSRTGRWGPAVASQEHPHTSIGAGGALLFNLGIGEDVIEPTRGGSQGGEPTMRTGSLKQLLAFNIAEQH
jgi:hypothetical protein